jgi:hypothetical protein
MSAVEPNWAMAIMLAGTWLVGCAGLLFLFGHLPLSAAPAPMKRGVGPALIVAGLAVMAGVLMATVLMAADALRWTTSIVLGGFVFLFAPFLVQDLPASIKETQGGLALVVAAGALVLAAMYTMAQSS